MHTLEKIKYFFVVEGEIKNTLKSILFNKYTLKKDTLLIISPFIGIVFIGVKKLRMCILGYTNLHPF
jgi:hypothetical protein